MNIMAGLEELAKQCTIVFPVHPRTQLRIKELGLGIFHKMDAATKEGGRRGIGNSAAGIILTDPLGYLDFLCLMKHATLVVTDSGGIQEETTCLGIPCVTVRENTERPVTVNVGTNIIAGTDSEKIAAAVRRQMGRKAPGGAPDKWDGQAAVRILGVLISTYRAQTHGELAVPSGV